MFCNAGYTAVQKQNAGSAYFIGKHILHIAFAEQYSCHEFNKPKSHEFMHGA